MALYGLAFRAGRRGRNVARRARRFRDRGVGFAEAALEALIDELVLYALAQFPILELIPDLRARLFKRHIVGGQILRDAAADEARQEWARQRRFARGDHRRNLQLLIDATTRRRTGALRNCAVRARQRGQTIVLTENFPRTAFLSRNGRRGQYAWVVNGGIPDRRFIQRARRLTLRKTRARVRVAFFQRLTGERS